MNSLSFIQVPSHLHSHDIFNSYGTRNTTECVLVYLGIFSILIVYVCIPELAAFFAYFLLNRNYDAVSGSNSKITRTSQFL